MAKRKNRRKSRKQNKSDWPFDRLIRWAFGILTTVVLFVNADSIFKRFVKVEAGNAPASQQSNYGGGRGDANNTNAPTHNEPSNDVPTNHEDFGSRYGVPNARKNDMKMVSWNAYEMGSSKSEAEINYMAYLLSEFDLILIQEVVSSFYGSKAIGKLVDELDRRGAKHGYTVSDITTGLGKERYAFIWKTNEMRLLGLNELEEVLEDDIDREPFVARFENRDGKDFFVANFHAVPQAKYPEYEVALLYKIAEKYPNDKIIMAGDFNVTHQDDGLSSLYASGFKNSLAGQETTLKRKVYNGDYLANPYDNIFYESKYFRLKDTGVLDFVKDFESLSAARKISDHLPVWGIYAIR